MDFINLDDKLFALQMACRRHHNVIALWVSYAMERYFLTGRATHAFERAFLAFPESKFPALISECMNGDASDVGIIATCKRIFSAYM